MEDIYIETGEGYDCRVRKAWISSSLCGALATEMQNIGVSTDFESSIDQASAGISCELYSPALHTTSFHC